MATFDFVAENPVGGVGFVYKSTTAAYYYDGTSVIPIGQNAVFTATTGTGTSVMNISSVASGTIAPGQIIGTRTTVTFSAPSTVNWTANGMAVGTAFKFLTTGTLPTGIDVNKTYYVKTTATNTITFAESASGPTVTFSGTGTGTHTGVKPVAVILSYETFDGTSGTVNLNNTATWTNPTTFSALTNYPAETVRGIPYLDGTYYVMDPNGSIYGSGINDPTEWSSLNVIQSQAEPDGGVCLARQLQYIVAFNEYSTEFFYDAGNESGSPLLPYSSSFLEVGCAVAESVSQTDNSCFFMGVTKQKGRGLYMLEGTSPVYLSNPFIDRILNKSDLSEVTSFCIRIAGHIFYVLCLGDLDKTIALDTTTKEFSLWSILQEQTSQNIVSLSWANRLVTGNVPDHGFTDGQCVYIANSTPETYNGFHVVNVIDANNFSYESTTNPGTYVSGATVAGLVDTPFNMASYTSGDNLDMVQDSTTGFVYFLDNGLHTDDTIPIKFRIRTFKFDGSNNYKKFVSQTEIVGDKTDSTGYLRYTNDDYQTWSKYRPVDLASDRSILNRGGQLRRRAYEVLHYDPVPQRFESLEIIPTEGQF